MKQPVVGQDGRAWIFPVVALLAASFGLTWLFTRERAESDQDFGRDLAWLELEGSQDLVESSAVLMPWEFLDDLPALEAMHDAEN